MLYQDTSLIITLITKLLSHPLISDNNVKRYSLTNKQPIKYHTIPRPVPTDAHSKTQKTPRMRMRLERKDGHHASLKTKTCYLCYIMCFSCFCHLCYMCYEISTGRKTNKPRGRASAVSTISTCFSLCYYLLPTPPPISVRKDGGITVVYLCGF